jgi:GMP reductase
MNFQEEKYDFKDVLIRPKRSTLESRADVILERIFKFPNTKTILTCVPIIASNMDTVGTFQMSQALSKFSCLTFLNKHYSLEDYNDHKNDIPWHCIGITAGAKEENLKKLDNVMDIVGDDVKVICLDIANGYSEFFINCVKKVRYLYPDHILIAGNVVTGDITQELILNGADVVKVGIGPGSACKTRRMTGIGYPQLSAIIECSDAAHGLGGHIIADGGCKEVSDIVKAFAGGADFVMLGGMLAGHDESGGEWVKEDGKLFRMFYGMSSETAMCKYYGKVADYRTSEGLTMKIPYKGSVNETIKDILGGVRSACTYVGAKQLKYLPKCTTFVFVK